jgi:hypothetical protein
VDYIFKDINLSVLPTLKEIYSSTESVIKDLEKLI